MELHNAGIVLAMAVNGIVLFRTLKWREVLRRQEELQQLEMKKIFAAWAQIEQAKQKLEAPEFLYGPE